MMMPFRVTHGSLVRPGPEPGWTFCAGGGDCQDATGRRWPLGLVWLTLEDPTGRRWMSWFNSYFSVQIALPRDCRVTQR
jgi:hypothetical protein